MKRILTACAIAATALLLGPAPAPAADRIITAASCAAGETFVKAYVKADGTKVAAYCQAKHRRRGAPTPAAVDSAAPAAAPASAMSGSAASATTCADGETFVKGYTRKDGSKVAGYCRHKGKKKS